MKATISNVRISVSEINDLFNFLQGFEFENNLLYDILCLYDFQFVQYDSEVEA